MDIKEKIERDLKAIKIIKFYVKQALGTVKVLKDS